MTAAQSADRAGARGALLIAGAFLGVLLSQTPVVFLSLGAFMAPLHAGFGWQHSRVAAAIAVSTLALALASPFAGALMDRWGARRLLLTSLPLLALALMSLYFLSDSLWHLYAMYAVIGVVGAGANTMPYARLLVTWFDRRRGLALGIAMAALGLGGDVSSAVATRVMAAYDWRAAFAALGLLVFAGAWPLAFWLTRDAGAAARSDADHRAGMTRSEALRSPTFWMLAAIFFLLAGALHGLQIHMLRVLGHNGLQAVDAAAAMTAFGVALVVGRVGCGYLFDHHFAPRVALMAFVGSLAGLMLVGGATTPVLALTAAFLAGLGPGAETALLGFLVSRYFGFKAFGAVYGCIFAADMLGTAIGIYGWGWNYDLAGSYRVAELASTAAVAAVCVLLYRLGPFPARGP